MSAPSLTFEAVIPNTGTPIGFAGGEGEAGLLKLQHYMTAEQIQTLLSLRGSVLSVTIIESED
jgi:hypothetical protein